MIRLALDSTKCSFSSHPVRDQAVSEIPVEFSTEVKYYFQQVTSNGFFYYWRVSTSYKFLGDPGKFIHQRNKFCLVRFKSSDAFGGASLTKDINCFYNHC